MSKIKKIYLLLIAVSMLISLYGIHIRIGVEKDYDNYEMVMGLKELKVFASKQNREWIEVAEDFVRAGIHTVIIDEETIESLKQDEEHKLGITYRGLDIHLHADRQLLSFIEEGIRRTLKEERNIYYSDEHTLTIEGRLSDLGDATQDNRRVSNIEKLGLGYNENDIDTLKKAGIRFALRPTYQKNLQDGKKVVDTYFSHFSRYAPDQSFLMFGSGGIPGGKENIPYLQERLKQFQLTPVIIENSQQDGNFDSEDMLSLIKSGDYKVVRLFSTWTFIQMRYDYGILGHHEGQEIINTYYRAITERNIRLIFFRFFLDRKGETITDMDIYRKRLGELEERLYRNYKITPVIQGEASSPLHTMKQFALSKKIKMLAIFGTIIAYLLLAEEFIGRYKKIRYTFWALAILLLLGSVVLYSTKSEQIFALLASIAFPTLSIVYLMKKLKYYEARAVAGGTNKTGDSSASFAGSFLNGIRDLLVCMLISMIGAVFVMTLYADTKYLFEFSKFSGVKASQMIPLIAVIILYFVIIGTGRKGIARFGSEDSSVAADSQRSDTADSSVASAIAQIKAILQQNVKVWQMILLAAIIGILGIMMARSGHTSNIEPPSFELWFRNFLEQITPARPRTKAIFLGFPALIILVMLANRLKFRLSYPLLLLAATIGQANLVNSFSHIRTPVSVSLYRVLGEFVVSTILVFIILLFIHFGKKLYQRIGKHA